MIRAQVARTLPLSPHPPGCQPQPPPERRCVRPESDGTPAIRAVQKSGSKMDNGRVRQSPAVREHIMRAMNAFCLETKMNVKSSMTVTMTALIR